MKVNKESTLVKKTTEYFEKTGEVDMYKCKLCNYVRNGKKQTNLTSHLKNKHNDVYLSKIKRRSKDPRVQLRVERLKLLQICVELITINHQPFANLYKSGFQKLIEPKIKMFAENGIPLSLHNKNLYEVKSHLMTTANAVRDKIKSDLKNRLFSMSADIVKKNNRSILGIYVHLIKDGILQTRCIGMKELTESHTGEYLSRVIKDCLSAYGCQMNQVMSITTDNGSNMNTLLRNMNKVIVDNDENEEECNDLPERELNNVEITDITDPAEQNLIDAEINTILNMVSEEEEDEINALAENLVPSDNDIWTIDDYSSDVDLVNILTENNSANFVFVNGINCAAHTLQLAVKDALGELNERHGNVIALTKKVAKFFRHQNTIYTMGNLGIKKKLPCLSVDTRWGSTYLMVNITKVYAEII